MSDQGGDTRFEIQFRLDAALIRIKALEAALRDAAARIEGLNPAIQKSVDDWRERGERIEALEAALRLIDGISTDYVAIKIARGTLASEHTASEYEEIFAHLGKNK